MNPDHMQPARREVPEDASDSEVFRAARKANCQMHLDQAVDHITESILAMEDKGELQARDAIDRIKVLRAHAYDIAGDLWRDW